MSDKSAPEEKKSFTPAEALQAHMVASLMGAKLTWMTLANVYAEQGSIEVCLLCREMVDTHERAIVMIQSVPAVAANRGGS